MLRIDDLPSFLSRSLGRRSLAFACLSVLLLPAPAPAQTVDAQARQGKNLAKQRMSSAEILAQFEEPEDSVYRLGEGDEITVEIWGRPELSGKHVIGPDGIISVPVAGNLRIAGLSREDGVAAITQALHRYYTSLSVLLRVDRYTSNRVFILGRVAHPGALQFDVPPTLLEAITTAGSLPIGGIGAEKAALTRCAVFRGRDKVVWIDLRRLLKSDDLAMNLRLRRNDVVYIPDADDQLVYVLGEVQRPGAFRLTPEMVFLDAFAQAGGLTSEASDKLQIIRPATGTSEVAALASLVKPDPNANFLLEEGDIIYAPKRTLSKVGYVMEKISPFTTYLLIGAALKR